MRKGKEMINNNNTLSLNSESKTEILTNTTTIDIVKNSEKLLLQDKKSEAAAQKQKHMLEKQEKQNEFLIEKEQIKAGAADIKNKAEILKQANKQQELAANAERSEKQQAIYEIEFKK